MYKIQLFSLLEERGLVTSEWGILPFQLSGNAKRLFSIGPHPPAFLELGWLGDGFVNFVCVQGLFSEVVAVGVFFAPEPSSLFDSNGYPGCCWCGSLFWVEK